jgi:hypothetical protein
LVLTPAVGGRFWIGLVGISIAIAIAGVIILAVFGAALAAWGLLGALIVFGGVAIGLAWLYDRRRGQPLDPI